MKNGYFVADDENGNVFDPTSEIKTLNDIKIRLKNNNGKISTKIIKK